MKTKRLPGFWAPLIVILLLLPAMLPLLHVAGLPCTHDNALHYYRITAMREALRQGWLFSRWAPNLALGYGYPFFNFREPLPYLLGELLYVVGIPLPLVLGLIDSVSLAAAALGAYVLARALFGERAAWVAAVAYGLGPYLLLDVLRRGNMPESVALVLLPWLLFSLRQVILGGGRRPFVASVLLLAALFLSHNISSLLFAPFLGGYVVLLSWIHRGRRAWPWAFVAAALALALTAWFWLPALAEQGYVQLHLSRTTRNNDFHYNFVTWGEMLFSPPAPHDPDFLNPPMCIALGIAPLVLALAGAVVGLRRGRDHEQRWLTGYLVGVALVYLWMSTPASVGVWESLPFLAFVQFPWRLVGRALLPVALLAGAAFSSGRSQVEGRASHITFYAAVVALVALAWPLTYPPKGICAMKPFPGMADVYAFEREGWLGVDPEGSYFPVWVEQHPTDTALAEAFVRGEEPARLDVTAMPQGAQVTAADYRPLRASLTVETPDSFQARWLGLYFPGWQVRIDGAPVTATPEEDTGLLTFPVPAGRHTINVRLGETPLRSAATAVSAVGFGFFLLLAARPGLESRITNHEARVAGHLPPAVRNSHLALLAVALLALKLLVVDRAPNPARHSRLAAGALPEVRTPLTQPFTGGLTLLGYTLDTGAAPADGEMQVDLLWQAREQPLSEMRTSVLLVGPDGQPWSPAGTLRPRGYEAAPPTTMWTPGQYSYDPHVVQLLPGAPPGEYRVVAALFDRATLTPASVLGPEGSPAGPDLTLGTVQVTRPQHTPDLKALGVPEGAIPQRCGAVGLWNMTADRERAAPGEVVGLRWVWEAFDAPEESLTATLTLRDDAGASLREWGLPPVAAWWPTDRWDAGDRWVGRHGVYLPASLESGEYSLAVFLPGCDLPLGTVTLNVIAPERVWEVPPDMTPAEVVFGERIRLVGYAWEPAALRPGEPLRVRLAWQALTEMTESYRVFLHLIGPDNRVVTQSDGIPAAWTRPTTGWAIDEVIVEERELSLPADALGGDYQLMTGLYILYGPRLPIAQGGDVFTVGIVQVVQ